MTDHGHFIDYYDVLQVDPNCDERALEVAEVSDERGTVVNAAKPH